MRRTTIDGMKPDSGRGSIPRWNLTNAQVIILVIAVVMTSAWFGARVAKAISYPAAANLGNHLIVVDGTTYPYTAAGIQAAINNVPTPNGTGGAVMLPATEIPLGETGLTMRKHVCLIGVSSDSSWLTYSGAGAAITFPPRTIESCLRHVTVALGSRAGANAFGIRLLGNISGHQPTVYVKIQDVSISSSAFRPGQTGMDVEDLSRPQPAPSGVQLSWFDTIKIVNVGQPIVINGQEGNFWNGIHIDGFYSIAVNDAFGADDFWQIRITGPTRSSSSIGFQEAGRMNQIGLTCDFGKGSHMCINDTGGKNMWDVSALTPPGVVASSSFLHEIGSNEGNIPSRYQVSSLAR
jgi:hypothetical protein